MDVKFGLSLWVRNTRWWWSKMGC